VSIERLDHLVKRDAKLTRDVAILKKQVEELALHVARLSDALKRSVPHMNLGEGL